MVTSRPFRSALGLALLLLLCAPGAASADEAALDRLARLGPALEITASWLGGSGQHELACTNPAMRAEDMVCVGNQAERNAVATAIVPASLQVAIDGFPARALGIGARLYLDWAVPSGLPDARSPGVTVQVEVGPQLRILPKQGQAGTVGWIRAELRFASSFTQMSPLAGSAKYAEQLGGYLDAGSWSLANVGGALRLEAAIQLGGGALLYGSGRLALYAPMPGSAARQVVEPQPVELVEEMGASETHSEEVEILPELLTTSQLSAGGRIGVLFPGPKGSFAIGPVFGVQFLRAGMTFPDRAEDCWEYGSDDPCEGPDNNYRKVFSTRRTDLYVTGGVEARFGVAPKQ
jgi:hypothetical protein